MLSKFKNVYVLAPHTDDGELGAGGTISKLIEQGANIFYFAFSSAAESVPEGFPKDILKTEVLSATAKLGIPNKNVFIYNYQVRRLNYSRQDILETLVSHSRKLKPDLALMPSFNDIHQDHATIAIEAVRAFKFTNLLSYEMPWNNFSFSTTNFFVLSENQIQTKVSALKKYKSQKHRPYANEEFIRALARTRGVQIGEQYAEVFEVIRLIN